MILNRRFFTKFSLTSMGHAFQSTSRTRYFLVAKKHLSHLFTLARHTLATTHHWARRYRGASQKMGVTLACAPVRPVPGRTARRVSFP